MTIGECSFMPGGICACVEHCGDEGCQAGTDVIYRAGFRAGMEAAAKHFDGRPFLGSVWRGDAAAAEIRGLIESGTGAGGAAMSLTVADVKRYCAKLPDDAPVFIEYPARYGLAQPQEIETIAAGTPDEADLIEALTIGCDGKRLIIFHHF